MYTYSRTTFRCRGLFTNFFGIACYDCVEQSWKDYELHWEPSQHGNINFSLRIDPDRVWKPDIVLFNK